MSNVFSGMCNVSKDAEVRQTQAGTVLSVNLANNVGFGDKQKTNWIQASLWGKRAEGQLVDWLKKGQSVFVSGELSVEEYTANDGTTKTSLRLNLSTIDLVGGKKDTTPRYEQNPAPVATYAPKPAPTAHEAHRQAVAQHNQQSAPVGAYNDDIPF